MRLTVKRPSTKGFPFFLVRAPFPLYAPTPSADPRPRSRQPPADADGSNLSARAWLQPHTQGAFSAGHHMRTVTVSASPVVNTRRSIQCFALLVVNTRRSITPAAQLRRRHRGTCQFSLRDLVVQHAGHHPCWKAAHFLPCTLPPDVLRLPRAQRGRIHYGPSQRRAFVATRSGFQTPNPLGHVPAQLC